MAVQNYLSNQRTEGYRKRPTDDHGKFRIQYFEVPASAVTVQGDANSTFDLCKLPPGQVRIIPAMSRVSCSALGSSRTLDIGHGAYSKRPPDNDDEAENFEALIANLDVSSAVNGVAFGTDEKYDIYSRGGVDIKARVQGGTVPVGATLHGFIVYVYE